MRVAINGFGRIGRNVLRVALEKGVRIVAINDIHGSKDAAYLFKYDSVYGRYSKKVTFKGDELIVGNKKIKVYSERDPSKLPWKKLKVDLVVESTGVFTDRIGASKHIEAGAKKVIITSTSKDADVTIVPGVNDKILKRSDKIIALASCTTNALAPITKILNKSFRIERAMMTTDHAYTSSQDIVDSYNESRRRGRAGSLNIVPTTTGATQAVIQVLPELKGRIKGVALRVPVANGSIVDLVVEVKKRADKKKVNSVLKKASKREMKGIIEFSMEELVSSDIIGNPNSAVIDGLSTEVNGNLIKILAWYDNEYGYSNRVVDFIKKMKF